MSLTTKTIAAFEAQLRRHEHAPPLDARRRTMARSPIPEHATVIEYYGFKCVAYAREQFKVAGYAWELWDLNLKVKLDGGGSIAFGPAMDMAEGAARRRWENERRERDAAIVRRNGDEDYDSNGRA